MTRPAPRRTSRTAPGDTAGIVAGLDAVHQGIRDRVRASTAAPTSGSLTAADDSLAGDTVYAIDRVGDADLLEMLERHLAPWLPLVVVAEGLADSGLGPGVAVVPTNARVFDAKFRVVVDPIDGTRGLMYGKRSAWILTGVAIQPSDGSIPTLQDVDVAIQTEIPTPKQAFADTLAAVRGRGVTGRRTNLFTGQSQDFRLTPSTAGTIAHGFGQVMRAFPGGRDVLAAVDDDICRAILGSGFQGKATTFEDQYISSGGQLAELAYGHDRWVVDVRPLLAQILHERGLVPSLCCHPYDVCTALVAEEAGVVITDPAGGLLDPPLTVDANVGWVGYANDRIRALVEPELRSALRRHRMSR